jgi:hypothetical protein
MDKKACENHKSENLIEEFEIDKKNGRSNINKYKGEQI